ncbi:MFS general substrate transporter [Ramaria rubella]|nr:MFS general substrate transporter [Ramaria rubella]
MISDRAPLLQDEERNVDNPSVCKRHITLSTADRLTPLPWRVLFVVLMLIAVQPLAFEIIFPFVNQMILEIGVVTDPKHVGFYSGLIESIFSCMSFITSASIFSNCLSSPDVLVMPSSYLADSIGRKPVILGGILGLSLSVAAFGMSKSFFAMVISRCLGGALGGAWVCSKIMIAEQTNKSNQASAFQWLAIAYRFGQIIGLPLGGLLAHPARNFSFFKARFWYEYPFALPCFVASAFALCSVIMGCFVLQETLPKKKMVINRPTYRSVVLSSDGTDNSAYDSAAVPIAGPSELGNSSIRSILTPSIISLMASIIAMSFASEAMFSVFPLFAFTPIASGGLGLNEAAIGTYLAVRAVLHIGMMGFYAPLERRFGSASRMYHFVMWMWPLTVLCAPLLNSMARRGGNSTWTFNLTMIVFFTIWSASSFAWTSISIMVTNAAPSAGDLSTINGLSQMASAISQAIAPALVTSLFAIFIRGDLVGGNILWILLFTFTCVAALHSMTLHEPTFDWRNENE